MWITRALRTLARRHRRAPRASLVSQAVAKLHIGAGRVALPDWTNVDLEPLPGVDSVVDVRDGLPFRDVRFIFAEHFIEHLSHDEGVRFLAEARRALIPEGILRLSTPNLEWVLKTQYGQPSSDRVRDCFAINKAFRGWGHQFLYNRETLRATLLEAGFASVEERTYGMSPHEELRRLEHHETYADSPELPHVIILEASGVAPRSDRLDELSEEYDWAVNP